MDARIRDIVDYILQRIVSEEELPGSVIALFEALLKRGYHLHEIDSALELIFSAPVAMLLVPSPQGRRDRSGPPPRRVFTTAERVSLTLASQGVLIRLADAGLITEYELEEVLFQAVRLGAGEIEPSELLLLLKRIIRDESRLAMLAAPGMIAAEESVERRSHLN